MDGIRFLQLEDNLGFAAGNNKGIELALSIGCTYVMLLNNDTVIAEDMIEELHSKSSSNTVTVPKMYYYNVNGEKNIIWYAGGVLKYKGADGIHIGGGKRDSEEYSIEKKVTFATGCCMLVHKDILEKIGLLREEYFMYVEDTDYSIRLNQNNVDILYVPSAKLWHKVSSSSGGEMSKFIIYYVVRNRMHCAIVNKLGWKTYLYIVTETVYRLTKTLLGQYYTNYTVAPKGLMHGIKNKMGKNL